MDAQKQSVKNHAIALLRSGIGLGIYGAELHHELFNVDYFIIGTHLAKKWLGEETFDCIGMIKEYEQDNFGQVSTDLTDPEKVANMAAYILGEELLAESPTLSEFWDYDLTEDEIKMIEEELQEARF